MEEEIKETSARLFELLIQFQNSGEADDYESSALTAGADDLNQKVIVFFEKLKGH